MADISLWETQGASLLRLSDDISNEEGEHAIARLAFEKLLHVSVFQRESADRYAAEGGTTRSDVELWRETSVSTHASAPGTFLALRFRADQGAAFEPHGRSY